MDPNNNMDPLGELLLDLEELQQQDDFAAMVELDMVDMEDMVELDALDEPATKVCVPACDPPCAPSLEPLTDISGYLLTTEASTVYVCDVTSDTKNYKLKGRRE